MVWSPSTIHAGLSGDAALLQRGGKCGEARLSGVQPCRSADEGDVSVSQRGEMLHALADAVVVVHFEQADAWALRPYVDEDQGNFAFGELIEQGLFDAEGHDGYAFDLALQHAANAVGHAFGIVVGGADEDLVAVFDGDIFKSLDQLGEERIGDFGDDKAEELAAARDQGAGLGVGEVVEFVDHLPDALGDLGVDGGDVVDGAGDGRDGDIGCAGDGADVHAFRCLVLSFCGLRFFIGHSVLDGRGCLSATSIAYGRTKDGSCGGNFADGCDSGLRPQRCKTVVVSFPRWRCCAALRLRQRKIARNQCP